MCLLALNSFSNLNNMSIFYFTFLATYLLLPDRSIKNGESGISIALKKSEERLARLKDSGMHIILFG